MISLITLPEASRRLSMSDLSLSPAAQPMVARNSTKALRATKPFIADLVVDLIWYLSLYRAQCEHQNVLFFRAKYSLASKPPPSSAGPRRTADIT